MIIKIMGRTIHEETGNRASGVDWRQSRMRRKPLRFYRNFQ